MPFVAGARWSFRGKDAGSADSRRYRRDQRGPAAQLCFAEPSYADACALGLRPRRAAARPGIFPAHSSQRSATFEPRLASEYVTRSEAPCASSTSRPQLSQTNTVFRAKFAS
jgi:hypothetical protein